MAAVASAREVFQRRGIGVKQRPAASPSLLPLDEAAEQARAASLATQIGTTSPALEQYTTTPLFKDLWRRPDLAPRDRSLVTVSALIASGHHAQIPFHLNRAIDNGLTQTQAGEALAHLAFDAGWPNAMSAAAVARDVFQQRAR